MNNDHVSYIHGKCPWCSEETDLQSMNLLENIEELMMVCPQCYKSYIIEIQREITYVSRKYNMDPCSSCCGSGLQTDINGEPTHCSKCGGSCVERARDKKGRFK